jgi:hypothetical protein
VSLLGGFLIQTLTLLSILILASVCIRLVCVWITLASLALNSFSNAFYSLGNEMCSIVPTSFQKCLCIFSLFLSSFDTESLIFANYALNLFHINLCRSE